MMLRMKLVACADSGAVAPALFLGMSLPFGMGRFQSEANPKFSHRHAANATLKHWLDYCKLGPGPPRGLISAIQSAGTAKLRF